MLYINYASTRLLQRSKNSFIEYKKQIFPNDSYIHLKACDAASSYHRPSPIFGYNITKWDLFLNCCSDFPMMVAPFIESSEKDYRLFPDYLHKIKFHIFQNISKLLVQKLKPFKYNNISELCYIIIEKDKKGRIMVNICFVLHEEVIYVFVAVI